MVLPAKQDSAIFVASQHMICTLSHTHTDTHTQVNMPEYRFKQTVPLAQCTHPHRIPAMLIHSCVVFEKCCALHKHVYVSHPSSALPGILIHLRHDNSSKCCLLNPSTKSWSCFLMFCMFCLFLFLKHWLKEADDDGGD